ncbi:MAG: SH3 domain-containing protein [bacterium]|nr:SH3 domain-containing protein [bacterium]
MKSSLTVLFLVFAFIGSTGAQLRHGDPAIRVVGANDVNMRSEPNTGPGTLIDKIKAGTLMKRLDKRGGWYQVLLPDGREAWMSGRYAEEVEARDLLEITKPTVNVRSNASTASRQVGTVNEGDMLSLVRERNGWFQAILPDGKRGWIRNDMVHRHPLSPPNSPVEEATAPATEAEPETRQVPPEPEPIPVDPYQAALDLTADGKIDEAIEAFQDALKTKPNDSNIHFDLAKVYKQADKLDDALVHFRRARQLGGRDEAKFFIEDILKLRAQEVAVDKSDEASASPPDLEIIPETEESEPIHLTVFLPYIIGGSVVFLGILGLLVWRRRKALKPDQPTYRRRNQEAGFDSVLKYAVEKRPLFRAIEEAERKRLELDESLQQRLATFGNGGSPKLPTGQSSESLLKKIEDLRKVILNQEERAQIYADLIVLQNEKLSTLDEEVDALKKLIQIDYQEVAARKTSAPGKDKG